MYLFVFHLTLYFFRVIPIGTLVRLLLQAVVRGFFSNCEKDSLWEIVHFLRLTILDLIHHDVRMV
jgi:hypothetical protein